MPSVCYIRFNENPAGVYYGGQVLSGSATLTTDQNKTIRGIYVRIRGYAEVKWVERRTSRSFGRTTTHSTHYHARENYFDTRVDVMRSAADGESFELTPGKYHYNFQLVLPEQLPSSFTGQFGEIRYEVIFTLDRPWRFDNVFKQPFTVISPLHLNMNAMYGQPVERYTSKTFSAFLCCGNSGEIFVKGNIPMSGFVPGQYIPLKILIRNQTNIRCDAVNAKLTQNIEYHSQTPYKKSKIEMLPVTVNLFGPLEQYQDKEFTCNLYIPAIPPTSSPTCTIIEVTYYIRIKLRTSGFHRNMDVRLPITIGTTPYTMNITPTNVPSSSQEQGPNSDGIYIRIRGYADVRWEEHQTTSSSGNSVTTTINYHARENYFETRVDVMRSAADGESFELTPGRYHYNFQLVLPEQLPSSFTGQFGEIRYEVIFTIDRPWRFDNVFKQPFTVINPLHLNMNAIYGQPVERCTTKTFSSILFWGNSGEIFVKGNIPMSGFVPGQLIPLKILVKNQTNIRCDAITAKLTQNIEYRSQTPYEKSKFEMLPVTVNLFGPLERHQDKEFTCNLFIPAIPPTSSLSRKIIEVTYYVRIKIRTRGLHRNMDVRLPITIGTAPYTMGMMPGDISSTSQGREPNSDVPPTYEESIKLGPIYVSNSKEDKHTAPQNYLPRYPFYPQTAINTETTKDNDTKKEKEKY